MALGSTFLSVIIGRLFPARDPFDPLAFALGIAREFGDIAYSRFGPLRVYQLNHPDLVQEVLVKQWQKFHKPRLMKAAFPIIGQGLIVSDGALWKQQRKLIQPAFNHHHLSVYAEVMVEHALRLRENFADGQIRDIGAEIAKLTLGIVVKTLFGVILPGEVMAIGDSMQALLEVANDQMNSALPIPWWVPTRRNLRGKRAFARLDSILHMLIQARRASSAAASLSAENRDDLLSLLLAAVDEETGARMSDQQLRDEMMTLFLAGHKTTAAALTWIWYLRHPGVEANVIEELDKVLAGRPPTLADLPQLPYTEMVVRETMRLYPPAPILAREPIEDVTVGGYRVAKRRLITISPWAIHRDPRFFPDPERFHPERFAPGWEAHSPLRVYSLWRRSARLHRQRLRDDGDPADSRNAGAALSIYDRSRYRYQTRATRDRQAGHTAADETRETGLRAKGLSQSAPFMPAIAGKLHSPLRIVTVRAAIIAVFFDLA